MPWRSQPCRRRPAPVRFEHENAGSEHKPARFESALACVEPALTRFELLTARFEHKPARFCNAARATNLAPVSIKPPKD